jgi:hypothetical protein
MNFTVHELPRAQADKRHILQWLVGGPGQAPIDARELQR